MGLKPMNCPGARARSTSDELRSYRDLPIRYAEQGLVHRHEPSGTLHGLLRVRHITQDDAHVFCTRGPDRGGGRCAASTSASTSTTSSASSRGSSFDPARQARRHRRDVGQGRGGAASARSSDDGLEYELNEGDGAFYGPKIDLHMTDAIGRSWQLGTVQLDYYMPERSSSTYTGADNAEHRPVMIHRALMGSFERFIGILIEHYAGEFPLWLAPVQAIVLPIADRHVDYAREVARDAARTPGCGSRSTSAPSRWARRSARPSCARCPYMLVVGDRRRPRPARSPCAGIGRAISGSHGGRATFAERAAPRDRG